MIHLVQDRVITYSVTDTAGNTTEVIRTISVSAVNSSSDTTAPVITLIGSSTINLTVGDTWTDPGATATDNDRWTETLPHQLHRCWSCWHTMLNQNVVNQWMPHL